GHAAHDDDELLAAVAREHVLGADRGDDFSRDAREEDVAGLVAVRVVDALEVVDVEVEQAEPALVAVREGDLGRETLVEIATVVVSHQCVARGRFEELARDALFYLVDQVESHDDAGAERDARAVAELGAVDAAAVDPGAVLRSEIFDDPRAAVADD